MEFEISERLQTELEILEVYTEILFYTSMPVLDFGDLKIFK